MTRLTILSAALIAAICGLPAANAATIFNDDFEGYSSQANFEATWALGAGTNGTWTTDQSTSPTHSIGTAAGATQANAKTFTDVAATDANPLVWSFQFYDDAANLPTVGNTLGRSYAQLRGRSSGGGLAQLLAMGLWNANIPKASDTTVTSTTAELRQYYAVRTAFNSSNWVLLDTIPQRSAGWHEMKAVIGDTKIEYLVDGTSAYTASLSSANYSYYQAWLGSGLSSGTANAYDDMSLVQVPEPATILMLGLGMIGTLALRRRS